MTTPALRSCQAPLTRGRRVLVAAWLVAAWTTGPTGCLDATPGSRYEPPDATGPTCRGVAELGLVARDVGDFALAPCGALAYWDEAGDRALVFVGADHRELVRHADPAGYDGKVTLSPSGRRVIASSLRSDLGFGDVLVGAFPARAPLEVDARIGFGGGASYLFRPDERLVVVAHGGVSDPRSWLAPEGAEREGPIALGHASADAYFYVADGEVEPTAAEAQPIVRHDLATGAVRSVTTLRRGWLEGSTVRTRDAFLVTGDGGRVVVTSECEPYGQGACRTALRRIVDVATGEVLLEPSRWLGPVVSSGALVAADGDEGAWLFTDAPHALPGHTVHALIGGELLTRSGGALWSVRGDAPDAPAHVIDDVEETRASERQRALAIRHRVGDRTRLALRIDGALVRTELEAEAIGAVDDGGHVLVRTPDGLALVGGDGRVRSRFDVGRLRSAVFRSRALFLELCAGNAGLTVGQDCALHRVDLASAQADVVARGHAMRYAVSDDARVLAVSYLPLSGTRRELHAGALPR